MPDNSVKGRHLLKPACFARRSCKRKNENRCSLVINVLLISIGMSNNKGKRPVQSQGTSLFRLDFNLLHVYCKE